MLTRYRSIRSGLWLLMVTLVWACNSTIEPDPTDSGLQYYPLEKGKFWEYDVTDIRYTFVDGSDTNIYQLKEIIADTFRDLSGQKAYRLERYVRENETSEWPDLPDSVWTIRATSMQIIRTENNIPYLKLSFPLKAGKSWDQNQWNVLDPKLSYVKNIDKSLDVNGKNYPKTLKVIEGGIVENGTLLESDSSLFQYRREAEWYGADIGLIQKERINLKYEQRNGEPVFPQKIGSGSIKYMQILKNHGTE